MKWNLLEWMWFQMLLVSFILLFQTQYIGGFCNAHWGTY